MIRKGKLIAASVLTAVACLSGCTDVPETRRESGSNISSETPGNSGSEGSSSGSLNVKLDGSSGTVLSFDGGNVKISRLNKENGDFKGDEGVWTVFVYMCATDLESSQGSATYDLMEMVDATESCSKLRFVVEADGTSEWWNDLCENNKKQRIVIENGDAEIVDSRSSTNMGKSETLENFLVWGLENYPSEHMVLDFWNHGGGSITGVCFDENFDMDSLSLAEIDATLAKVYGHMPRKFDIIGFDACLMATIETANILVPYGEYMLASQNLESGNGWDYNSFAEAIRAGAGSGAEVGTYLVNGYYNACKETSEEADATLSIIDLSKIDGFIEAFNRYAKDAYEYAEDHLSEVIKAAKASCNFGGNNRTEGYTNMVDIGDLLNNSSFAASSAKTAISALNNCVVYVKNGSNKKASGGLSLYYPLSIQGSREISVFTSLCISPYYLGLVDLCAYGTSTNGYTNDYDFNKLLDSFNDLWSGGSLIGNYNYWDGEDNNSLNFDQSNSALKYEIKPHLDDEGYYTFKLTEDSLYYLDTVYCNVMQSYWDDDDGREYMLDLGTDDYVDLDWETGECWDAFDGLWICMPDGQPLCTYLIDWVENNGVYSNIYTAPIYLNDEYTNLKIAQTYYDDGTVTEVLGTWDGVDEYGAAARNVYQLKNGDIIEPCYFAYDAETYEYVGDYYGAPYTYNSNDIFDLDFLEDADYYYSFEIYDYFDNALYTDYVLFGIEDGELYYYE